MTMSKKERSATAKRASKRGSKYQLKVAKAFTKLMKDNKLDVSFQSTPRSGGMRWQNRPDVIGDITCNESNFLLTIECKKYEDLDFHVLLMDRKPNTSDDFISFWDQACDEAIRASKQPVLVVEKKRGKSVIVIPTGVLSATAPNIDFTALSLLCRITLPENKRFSGLFNYGTENMQNSVDWEQVTVLFLKTYLDNVDVKSLFVTTSTGGTK